MTTKIYVGLLRKWLAIYHMEVQKFQGLFNSEAVRLGIFVGVCLIVVVVTILEIRAIVTYSRRQNFCREYKLSNIKDYQINAKPEEQYNYYSLSYPHWIYSNRDGTKDRRHRRNNAIVCAPSILHLGRYLIKRNDPFAIKDLVAEIRENNPNVIIQRNIEEEYKYEAILKQKADIVSFSSIEEIYRTYVNNPYDFELFTADLFRRMGCAAQTTSKTNDGGFDIVLFKNGRRSIVECKCYAPDQTIGRPLLQKLAGANMIAKAEFMVFVATCDFSREARKYAERVDITLINGTKLIELVRHYFHNLNQNNDFQVRYEDWKLTDADIYRHIPQDISW